MDDFGNAPLWVIARIENEKEIYEDEARKLYDQIVLSNFEKITGLPGVQSNLQKYGFDEQIAGSMFNALGAAAEVMEEGKAIELGTRIGNIFGSDYVVGAIKELYDSDPYSARAIAGKLAGVIRSTKDEEIALETVKTIRKANESSGYEAAEKIAKIVSVAHYPLRADKEAIVKMNRAVRTYLFDEEIAETCAAILCATSRKVEYYGVERLLSDEQAIKISKSLSDVLLSREVVSLVRETYSKSPEAGRKAASEIICGLYLNRASGENLGVEEFLKERRARKLLAAASMN